MESCTVVGESYVSGWYVCRQSHPLSHSLYDSEVSVDAGVNSLLPTAILDAGVATDIISMGLAVRHALAALRPTFGGQTFVAVWVTIGEAICSLGFHKGVGRKDQLYLPVSVGSSEHLHVEVSVPVDVFLLDQNWTCVSHIPWWWSWELVVVAVELNGIPFWRNGPSAEREFFGIVWFPYFDFGDIFLWESSLCHVFCKSGSVVVRVVLAHQKVLLSPNDDFQIGDEILGDVSSVIGFEFGKNGSQVRRRNVLSSIDSEARETNRQERCEVVSYSLPNVVSFSVEISQVDQPSIVEDKTISPRVERSGAVEVIWTIGNRRHLHSWSAASNSPVLIGKSLRPEGTTSTWIFAAPVDAARTMCGEHVVAISSHMVDNSICVDPHSFSSAGVDHIPQRGWVSLSGVQSVTAGLIEPVPRVQLSIFGVLKIKNRLLRREYFDAHVTCFPDHFALLSDIIIGPSEHLNDGSFLSPFVIIRLIDCRVVPHEVDLVQYQCSFDSISVKSFNLYLQQLACSLVHEEAAGGGLLSIVVIPVWEGEYLRLR